MMAGLPNVQADEHVYILLIQNHRHTRSLVRGVTVVCWLVAAAGVGIDVTKDPSSCLYQRSSAAKPVPVTTPPDHERLGAETMPGPTGQYTHILQQDPGYEKGNGALLRPGIYTACCFMRTSGTPWSDPLSTHMTSPCWRGVNMTQFCCDQGFPSLFFNATYRRGFHPFRCSRPSVGRRSFPDTGLSLDFSSISSTST